MLDANIDYEIVEEPVLPRSRRRAVIEATGQNRLPAIELDDGSWWHDDSHELAAAIRSGRLAGDS